MKKGESFILYLTKDGSANPINDLRTEAPISGKAAKRAARKVYNSDDEDEEPSVGFAQPGVPEAIEGQEDATMSELGADSEDELEDGPLEDLRAVERRIRNSARILGNWKELGAATGK